MRTCWVMAAALALSVAVAHAQTAAIDESAAGLEGVWASHAAFGPELSGELVITREGDVWRGSLGGLNAQGASLDIVFPNDQGRFHGVLADRGRVIEGWWTQPPGLPGQAYATPMRLEATRANTWRGVVTPLPQTFTLYLQIVRNEDGRWVGAFRNPEFNINGGSSRFFTQLRGDTVSFSTPDGEVVAEAALTGDRMRLPWPPLPAAVELQRVTDAAGETFFPRRPGQYNLARPARTQDGWRTGRPRDEGFDEAALSALVQRIVDADPAARRPQLIHSLLVARRGRLVLEEYFHGYDRETPHDIRSAGKTFASVLLGAVMRQGADIGPQTHVYELLAADGPFSNPDPRKQEITLAHLMTHTSGLDCNDNDDASPGAEGAMQGQSEQPDWWRFALDLPMAHDPGARYAYCTAGMNLVGAALHNATGEAIPQLFDRLIARPLQFGAYHWNLTPSGDGYLGGGVYMRPRDLLKLGQLHLNGGVWNGRRILSRDWVSASTAAHVEINEATTGMDADAFAQVATHGADGFAWHRYGVQVGERRVEAYEANGNGGQFLIVVPEYELVVVFTGGNYGQGGIWTRWRDDIVGAQIISAIRH